MSHRKTKTNSWRKMLEGPSAHYYKSSKKKKKKNHLCPSLSLAANKFNANEWNSCSVGLLSTVTEYVVNYTHVLSANFTIPSIWKAKISSVEPYLLDMRV
jgi:hypothetical protein